MMWGEGVLVTGASGFIGSHLVRRLRRDGRPVNVLLRDGTKDPQFEGLGCQVFRGDVTLPESIRPALTGCGSVLHCARGGEDLQDSREINVRGTMNVLTAAHAAGVRRVVYLSSLVAHGRRWPPLLTEDVPLNFHGDAYAVTKAESEREAMAFALRSGLEVTVVRPTIVYGPGSARVVADLDRVRYEQVKLVGKGRGLLNLIYIDDLVDGICLAEAADGAAGEAFLLSGDRAVTVREYFAELARMCGKPVPPRIGGVRARLELFWSRWHFRFTRHRRCLQDEDLEFMSHRTSVSVAKARRLIGFAPCVSLEEGMRKVATWLRDLGYLAREPVA